MNIMKTMPNDQRGQAATEFALAIPILALFLLTFMAISAMCIRGEIASLAAAEAARAASVYQEGDVADALRYANPRILSNAMSLELVSTRGGGRAQNWEGALAAVVEQNGRPYFGITSVKGGVRRTLPTASALTPDLSDEILSGGDSPSPYCRCMEGYCVCGFGN